MENVDLYDYNLHEKVNSINDLRKILKHILFSVQNESFWQVHTCNSCFTKFFFSIGEVRVYKIKGTYSSKRCHCCK